MIRWATLWTLLVALAATASAQDRPNSYRIEPGDELSISVLEDPGLNTVALVRPDGRISMPLAGTILAEGRSPEDVQAAIRRALSKDFVTPPTVTVSLTRVGQSVAPPGFFIIGEIGRPGRYPLPDKPLTLLQALSLAGGPGTFAAADRIQLRRRTDSGESLFLFNYEQIGDGALPADPLVLQDGDTVVVPQRGLFE